MNMALSIAKTGLEADNYNLQVISNNLANANTTAFKKNHAEFADLPYEAQEVPGSPTSQETNATSGIMMGTGTRMVSNEKIFTQGTAEVTGRSLDVAIGGEGFFQVQMPNGNGYAYTRAGAFSVNSSNQLTLPNGYVVQPAITLPTGYTQLSISEDGIVSANSAGSATMSQVGQLQIATFTSPGSLSPLGDNLYQETTSSGTATLGTPAANGYGKLTQGQLEGSNVNVVEEMVNMIEAQRGFEITSKAVTTVDNMMDTLTRAT